MKRSLGFLLTLALLLQLCACRVRTTLPSPEGPEAPRGEETLPPAAPPSAAPGPAASPEPAPPETPEQNAPEEEPDGPSGEAEDSERREYAPDAEGELTPEAETPLAAAAEAPGGNASPAEGEGAPANVESEGAEKTALETLPAEEAEELGIQETGETADSMETYYLTLLDSRLGALFECKRLYVYWETDEDYRTVCRTSLEHRLILGAGAYDVSAKLLEENLTVDDGWISRKKPDVVVKVAGGGSLDAAARSLGAELAARPGWEELPAVREGRVLLLSGRLLESRAGQIAAMVYLAKLTYPEQMEDVDPDEALRALTEEAGGSPWSGAYAFIL